jgi:hypothetical protein
MRTCTAQLKRGFTMKAFFAVIASGLIMASAPAGSATGGAGKSAADGQSGATTKRSANTKYCLDYEAFTGSRISKRECKTKAEWAAEGVNVDKL